MTNGNGDPGADPAEPARSDGPEETTANPDVDATHDRLAALLSVDLDAVAEAARRRRRIVAGTEDAGAPDGTPRPPAAPAGSGSAFAAMPGVVPFTPPATPERDAAPLPADWFDPVPVDEPTVATPAVGSGGAVPDGSDGDGSDGWIEYDDDPVVPYLVPGPVVSGPVVSTPVVPGPVVPGPVVPGPVVPGPVVPAEDDMDDMDDLDDGDDTLAFEGDGDGNGGDGGIVSSWAAQSPWRRRLSVGVLVALVAAGIGLAYAGNRIVRDSTAGEVVAPIADPDEAGFEAVVEPTRTFAVFQEVAGKLDSVTVLTLTENDRGGVVMVPDRTLAVMPIFGLNPMESAYDLGNPGAGALSTGIVMTAAIGDFTIVDATRWADLVRPVGPIAIDNPNEITVDGEVRFAVGPIDLAPEDVADYLAARVEGETDLARLFRHEVFWSAWLDAVAADGTPEAVPGELDRGIASFVRGIATSTRTVTTLPVEPSDATEYGEGQVFEPIEAELDDLVARLIPFPASPEPGTRPRVRILNGTDDTTEAATLAPRLPPIGVEVALIGNAGSATVVTTTIAYSSPEFATAARAIATELGVGTVEQDDRLSDSADITVTLGADYD